MINNEELINKIQGADYVLVGLGEEFEAGFEALSKTGIYRLFKGWLNVFSFKETDWEQIYPTLLNIAIKDKDEALSGYVKAYEKLKGLISDKDHFIISMNMDVLPYYCGIDREHYVAPYGNYGLLQCDAVCDDKIYDSAAVDEAVREMIVSGKSFEEFFSDGLLKCPSCGKPLTYNTVNSKSYNEKGYLSFWSEYQKWLMKTMNRRVLILELGVSMNHPEMIRWPFERLVQYNKKAELVRVGEKFSFLTPETGERGTVIPENSVRYIANL